MSVIREYAPPIGGALALVALAWWIWDRPAPPPDRAEGPSAIAPSRALGSPDAVDRSEHGPRVGARPVDRSAPSLEVRGRVEDPDGLPVTEGRVRLSCADGEVEPEGTSELDEDGMFYGTGCNGTTCAEFIHPSMIQAGPWIFSPEERTGVFTARALRRQGGVVVDADGGPVAAARLIVEELAAEGDDASAPSPFTTRNTVSDAEGSFSFAVVERRRCGPCAQPAGCVEDDGVASAGAGRSLNLLASAAGFRSAQRQVSLGDEPWRIVLEASTEVIRGQLVDEEGRPYPRAKILARASDRPAEIHHASVDGAEFELADIGDGPYELRAIQDGLELATASDVAAGEEVDLRGGLPAIGVALTLRIVDADGLAIPRAIVDGGPFVAAVTDAGGEVQALQVLPGAYSLRVRGPDRRAQRHPLMISDGEARVTARIELQPD